MTTAPNAALRRGREIWASRSCGDCDNGPPCRCHPGNFMEMLSDDERSDVQAYREFVANG